MLQILLRSVREYKKASIETPVFVTFEVILECLLPFLMASLIDQIGGPSIEPVVKYGLLLLCMAMLSLLFGTLSARAGARAGAGFAKNLRQDLYFKLQDFSFADVDKFSTSSLVTRMTTDVTNVQNAYQMIIRVAVRTPLMLIFAMVMSFNINARMALIFLCILPVLAVVLFGIAIHVHPIFKRIFKKYDALNASVQENLAGIRVVKSFTREDYEKQKFKKASGDVRNDFTHVEKILALNGPVMQFCIYTALLLVSFIGARLIISSGGSELTTGQLSSLITYGVQILSSMMMLSMIFVMITMSTESVSRICEVLTTESSLKSPENGVKEVKDGSIKFEDVSFSYMKGQENHALSDINLEIKSGETIGIIGPTGSAKTTLISLIPRLYDTTEGKVSVGGLDVKDYDLDTLRDSVAVVLQKNVLFSGTIKDNLRWGKKDATDEELKEACEIAQADEFISAFPDGYDTWIEQGGTNVSGGQKQRLCIARAILKNPKVLIFDDSTSAVDTKTDALIRNGLRLHMNDVTKIIIAQRASSVEHADRILVMNEGKIVQCGTHEELLAQEGYYRDLYETQTRNSEAM